MQKGKGSGCHAANRKSPTAIAETQESHRFETDQRIWRFAGGNGKTAGHIDIRCGADITAELGDRLCMLSTTSHKTHKQRPISSTQVTGIRILEARAQLGIAIGNQYPQTQQGVGDVTAQRTSRNLPNAASAERFAYVYDAGFDVAWELDFWGKFRRSVQAGVADLQASIADYDDNLVFLTSEVASTYVNLRTSEERLAVARANVKIQTE